MSVLDDVLQENLKIVFCGSAVGKQSAAKQAYYAGPGNQFWPVLARMGLTPHLFSPVEYRDVLKFGIGLTDINQIEFGADRALSKASFDGSALKERIQKYKPRALAFNGKKSAQMYFERRNVSYGLQDQTIGETLVFILPSTSGAARGFWDEEHWRTLVRHLNI
jgi:TDG/mug DNA glycosylase family protein